MARLQVDKSVELVKQMEVLINGLYEVGQYEQGIGLATLMEMISKHHLKNNQLVVRSKLMKSVLLSECGQMNESVQLLVQVSEAKGLDGGWVQQQRSEYYEAEQGENYDQKAVRYENYQTFYHDQNSKTINDQVKAFKDIGL